MPEPFELSPEHQLRELLNMILLLERCLALPNAGAASAVAVAVGAGPAGP